MGIVKFAANLTLLFPEHAPLDRFRAAADAGFTHVEFLFPHFFDLDRIERELHATKLQLVLIDSDPGDFDAGDRGYLCDPRLTDRFQQSVKDALRIARRFGVTRINTLVGKRPAGVSSRQARDTVVANLRRAAPLAEAAGVTLLLEPLNTPQVPGYFLDSSALGFELLRDVDSPAVKFLYDVYHLQILEGNLIATIRANLRDIGHFQISDVPGRHEPGTGEINFPAIFSAIDADGYDGYVGIEYIPAAGTVEGLDRWLPRERRGCR